jgi:GTP cyclohydrolase III
MFTQSEVDELQTLIVKFADKKNWSSLKLVIFLLNYFLTVLAKDGITQENIDEMMDKLKKRYPIYQKYVNDLKND